MTYRPGGQTRPPLRPPSRRRTLLIRGRQGDHEHGAAALSALFEVAQTDPPSFEGYQVVVYCPDPPVVRAAAAFAQATGIPVQLIPAPARGTLPRLLGCARVHLALTPTLPPLRAAMLHGAFPIHARTPEVEALIRDEIGGLLVPPHSPARVAQAIRRAITDDALVDQAARINRPVARATFRGDSSCE